MRTFFYILIFCFAIVNWQGLKANEGWEVVSHEQMEGVFDITFVDANNGWVCLYTSSSCCIYYSTNGGKNWNKSNAYGEYLNSIFFIDTMNGWAVGNGGVIMRSSDGGVHWESDKENYNNLRYNDIYFIDSQTGFICGGYSGDGESVILKTTDGGNNWERQSKNFACEIMGIDFVNSTTGIMVCKNGTILKTTDSGFSWYKADYTDDPELRSVKYIDEYTVFAVGGKYDRDNGQDAYMIKSTDGGETWNRVEDTDGRFEYWDICFTNQEKGWAVGGKYAEGCGVYSSRIFCTNDGGTSWEEQYPVVDAIFSCVCFLSEDLGWVAGGDNFSHEYILGTITGGISGIDELTESSISKIYPTPAREMINLVLPGNYDRNETYIINNSIGLEVLRFQPGSSTDTRVDISNLSAGLYFIRGSRGTKILGSFIKE